VLARAAAGRTELVWAIGSLMPAEADRDPLADMRLMLRALVPCLALLADRPELGLTLVSSGGTVYGRPSQFPTPETSATDPISAYGITRLTAEKYVLRHAQIHGNPVRVARVANVYGAGQTAARGQGFIAAALQCAADDEPLTLYGDGDVRRDFIHVADAADCLAAITLARRAPSVVNIGSGESARLTDIIQIIENVSGKALQVVRHPARNFDVPRVELAVDTLRSLTHFAPRPLGDGIADTWRSQFLAVSGGQRTLGFAAG
jgi:UDP-glucose 4-epimerase